MKWHPWHPHTYAVNTSSERMFDEPRSRNLEVQGFQNLARWLRQVQAEQASFSGREDPERSLCTLVLLKANLLMSAATPNFLQNTSKAQETNVERRIRLCELISAVTWSVKPCCTMKLQKIEKTMKGGARRSCPSFGWGSFGDEASGIVCIKRMNSSLSQNYQAFSNYIILCTPDNVAKQIRERERARHMSIVCGRIPWFLEDRGKILGSVLREVLTTCNAY